MAFRIRSATREDESIIWKATMETVWKTIPENEVATLDRRASEEYFREQVEAYVKGVRGERFVAEDDGGRFLGYIILGDLRMYYSPQPIGFVFDIWVKPEHRGKGVATFLLDRALAWCRLRGLPKLKLEVGAGNAEARELYEHTGFVVERLSMGVAVPSGEGGNRD